MSGEPDVLDSRVMGSVQRGAKRLKLTPPGNTRLGEVPMTDGASARARQDILKQERQQARRIRNIGV